MLRALNLPVTRQSISINIYCLCFTFFHILTHIKHTFELLFFLAIFKLSNRLLPSSPAVTSNRPVFVLRPYLYNRIFDHLTVHSVPRRVSHAKTGYLTLVVTSYIFHSLSLTKDEICHHSWQISSLHSNLMKNPLQFNSRCRSPVSSGISELSVTTRFH